MSTTAVNLLREQYTFMQGWLDGTMAGVTNAVAHDLPAAETISTIAGQFGHVITGIDFFILGEAAGQQPLAIGEFADKHGLSELPPESGDMSQWGRSVTVDIEAAIAYGAAVFAAVDAYLATLDDSDLARQINFGSMGVQPLSWTFNIMILNTYCHTGEISVLKGMQGLKGYPM